VEIVCVGMECGNCVLELSVEIVCVLEWSVGIVCVLEWSVGIVCWNGLLRLCVLE
jgi:hypothetical protein